MHLKDLYTHGNEKSEYKISMLVGPIFPLYLYPCILWGIDTEKVVKFTATGFIG